jgi:hypothetical protein
MEYVTSTELCDRLKISQPTLLLLRKQGLPTLEISPRVTRYDVYAVSRWLESNFGTAAFEQVNQGGNGDE